MRATAGAAERFRVNQIEGGGAEIYLYDTIGFFGISARDFLEQLQALGNVPRIELFIHSPGGEVFDGFAIFAQLLRHPAHKVVHIDGLAGSIASVIAMAGDEVEIASVGFVYVHRPWSFVVGYADDMEEEAKLLRQIEPSIASAYRPRFKGSPRELEEVLAGDGTWLSAEDALAAGLVDRVLEAKPPAAQQDLSGLAKVPPKVKSLWGGGEAVEGEDRRVARVVDFRRRREHLDLVRQTVAALEVPGIGAEGGEVSEIPSAVAAAVATLGESVTGARGALLTRKANDAAAAVAAARRRLALVRSRAERGVEL